MSKQYAQLSVCAFQILLALSLRPRHGYEIMQQIAEDTSGRIKIGPGSLYGVIGELARDGLITGSGLDAVGRRKYYELTEKGKTTLGAELSNIETTLQLGKKRMNSPLVSRCV